ncbi:hypothetical protein RAC89_16450 [Paenibacillus sp. GD4]|jgi:hypothetical protein|uniref:hypothetical protein n=1 Tax=Paenibacillus sp. GD4 TaxID=3068890 RepID=UPI00279689F0|nr:hypothetical protein [Paenibacillus sp. GD4]MDQ1911975.1 hypothetical protein [Paenibacillus sp. GD4]
MNERKEGLEAYSLTPKESVKPEQTAAPRMLRHSKRLEQQIHEKEEITNVPGDSAFKAALDVEEQP